LTLSCVKHILRTNMLDQIKHIQDGKDNLPFPMAFYDAVTVGERGQIVIPQAARESLGIKAGSKLLVMGGGVPAAKGLFIIKADAVGDMLRDMITHLSGMEEFLKNKGGEP
jgi:AbrB family looped-hinge helix DNA binding protein